MEEVNSHCHTSLSESHSLDEEAPDNLSTKEEKERCSGSYCQAIGFLVIKDDSISERPG
jgi:hypothetical protein